MFKPSKKHSKNWRYKEGGIRHDYKYDGILYSTICLECGKPLGQHYGMRCPKSKKESRNEL